MTYKLDTSFESGIILCAIIFYQYNKLCKKFRVVISKNQQFRQLYVYFVVII